MYKLIQIPKKKKGEFREICVPSQELKQKLRNINFELQKESLKFGKEVQGFVSGRSPTSNATAHIGYNFSLSFDLKDFFDSIKPEMVDSKWSECFIDGHAYQGLPTSPSIANLAAIPIDKAILKSIEQYIKTVCFCGENEKIVYTRYADDLTFSFNFYETYNQLKFTIPKIVESFGFQINNRKTHLQTKKFGRRIITGVAVDDTKIYAPREIRRKIRTARHKGLVKRLSGLNEWAKVKLSNSSPLVLNSLIFKDLNEVNRITNLLKSNCGNNSGTIVAQLTSNLPENYNFITPFGNIATNKIKNIDKKGIRINSTKTINKTKKDWKIRSKMIYKEIQGSGRAEVLNTIRDRVLAEINNVPKINDLTDEGISGNLSPVSRTEDLMQDLLE
jgi:hypothetical protein